MPIYEYVCHACGLEKEHLQKMSDAPIPQCPECGSKDYVKKISAASFRLKGTGWYVTDFRDKKSSQSDSKTVEKTETKKSDSGTTTTSSEKTATSTAATTSSSTE